MTILEFWHIVAILAVLGCAPAICWLDRRGLLGQPEVMNFLNEKGYFE